MKKRLYMTVVIFICSVISVFPVSADTAITQSLSESKTLVAYYSASGTTDRIAQFIAEEMNADTFVITPVDEYTDADLDWTDSSSRVVTEHNDPNRHTELVTVTPESFDNYDNIFIGYPIWWGIAAWPVDTFVKNNDFTGKTVIHPNQIPVVNEMLRVSQRDYADARAILNWDTGSGSLVSASEDGGRMNEYNTHSRWARRILLRAERYGVRA